MSYTAPAPSQYMNKTVGDGSDVAYVRAVTIAPPSTNWRPGTKVRNNHGLLTGTAIATFEAGQFHDHAAGTWAAIYLTQDEAGIRVLTQEVGHPVHEEVIPWSAPMHGQNSGDQFCVIE